VGPVLPGSPHEDDDQSSPASGDSAPVRRWLFVLDIQHSGGPASTGRRRRRRVARLAAVAMVVVVALTIVLIVHPQLGLRLLAFAASIFISHLGLS
jgi:hypothetical protein